MSKFTTRSHRHSRSFAFSPVPKEKYEQLNTRLSQELNTYKDNMPGDTPPRAILYLDYLKPLDLATNSSGSTHSTKIPPAPMPSLTLQRSNSWGLETTTYLSAADLASRMLQNPTSVDALSQMVHIRVEDAENRDSDVEISKYSLQTDSLHSSHNVEEDSSQQRVLKPIILQRLDVSPPSSPTTRQRRRRSPSRNENDYMKHGSNPLIPLT